MCDQQHDPADGQGKEDDGSGAGQLGCQLTRIGYESVGWEVTGDALPFDEQVFCCADAIPARAPAPVREDPNS